MKEVELMIKSSLIDVKKLKNGEDITSKVIFPKYSDGSTRYSEQELKVIFLNKMESSDFYYSVETPSNYQYRFKGHFPRVLLDDEKSKDKYQSSMIDVSVYDKQKNLISHIEFKHGQCPEFPIRKDFLKLICESKNINSNYFVHYLEVSDEKTM